MAAWSSWGAWLSPRQMFERASKVPAPDLVLFLKNVLLADEPIFASLGLPDSEELSSLLTDLVVDAQSCGASWVARGDVEGDSRAIVGVCLASAHSLIERQTDRIFSYDFREPKLHTAVEFVKFVLNKMDLDFFLSEASISRPVFVALLAVHRGHRRRGLARRLLDHSLKAARDEGHNGAVALSSSFASRCLLRASFPSTICRVRYKDYRGEERTPPIQPRGERDDELNVLLAPLSS